MNAYSGTWFQLFLDAIPVGQTDHETAFLARQLPRPAFGHVLDVCCGSGRHAHALANRGYRVVGLDRDRAALARAAATAPPGCTFVEGDLRSVSAPGGPFDAVTCLWQSFGFFDAAGNRAVLRDLHGLLRPGGRLVLDVYHRDFFEANQGTRTFTRGGPEVTERRVMREGRLHVTLTYGAPGAGSAADAFEWELFTPRGLGEVLSGCGFRPVLTCRDFDETRPAAGSTPRFQLVAERVEGRAGGGTPLPRRVR